MKSTESLTLKSLKKAVSGHAAAFRRLTRLEPAGGPGEKVFPPTYEGGDYATEQRRILVNGEAQTVETVLVNSQQAEANRNELAILDAWRENRLASLPVVTSDFSNTDAPEIGQITSLEAPHRIFDAILRDSHINDTPFRKTDYGARLDTLNLRNATALFELCPTALVFGVWDSTGPKGGLGVKFARAFVSEVFGVEALRGRKTSSRIDPLPIASNVEVYKTKDGHWTVDPNKAVKKGQKPVLYFKKKDGGNPGRPSQVNLGNVTPSIKWGGFTIDYAQQTSVLSLAGLRRLRFPIGDQPATVETDRDAQTTLAALALCAATLAAESGFDLRSRCLLVPTEPFVWELLDKPGEEQNRFTLTGDEAIDLFNESVAQAKKAGLPWMDEELVLTPSPDLVSLVRQSIEAFKTGEEEE